jgi:hypothetical protein
LTFQEYLTALDYAARSAELIEHLDDPWWYEVIALSVGVPGCDPVAIIRALLRNGEPKTVFMAAKCLETAIKVPLELRRAVENAIEANLLHQMDDFEMTEIGSIVAPILARNLSRYNVRLKSISLLFFTNFEYEPIIPLLIQLTIDRKPSSSNNTEPISAPRNRFMRVVDNR